MVLGGWRSVLHLMELRECCPTARKVGTGKHEELKKKQPQNKTAAKLQAHQNKTKWQTSAFELDIKKIWGDGKR